MDLEILVTNITKTSRDMWDRGWAEANGGNISLRLNEEQRPVAERFKPLTDWHPLGESYPQMAGEYFLVTGTGRYLRNIEVAPDRNVGIVEIDETGSKYRTLWGFTSGCKPTSELGAHLGAHCAIKEKSNNTEFAVIHTHATNIIALTYLEDFDSRSLTRLLWRMNTECIVVFPKGIEYIPVMVPGTKELAEATNNALKKRVLAVWRHHGIFGSGRNLDEAFGRIYVVEKSAEVYLKVMAAGGMKCQITDEQLRGIAKNFNCDYDKEFLD